MNKRFPIASTISLAIALGSSPLSLAQEDTAETESTESTLEEIIVTGSLGSLPGDDVEIFGFGKSLLETPRSASTISAEQLERFNVSDIDELISFAPGTFTQSFFGVARIVESTNPTKIRFAGCSPYI